MSVIEQVKMLPEPLLAGDFTENYTKQAKPKDKQAFFALAGKIHLDQYTVITRGKFDMILVD